MIEDKINSADIGKGIGLHTATALAVRATVKK